MSKKSFKNPAFKRRENVPGQSVAVAFHNVAETNAFHEVFETKPLDKTEALKLSTILKDGFINDGSISNERVDEDFKMLEQITADIRSIDKQAIVLKAERAAKAREILKPYRDGAFTQWLEFTFGTRRTGNNILAFHDLYCKLPSLEKEKLKQIPLNIAYQLASRNGDDAKKEEIIREHHSAPSKEIKTLIDEMLPVDSKDKRAKRSPVEKFLDSIEIAIEWIESKNNDLSAENWDDLSVLNARIEKLLDEKRISHLNPK